MLWEINGNRYPWELQLHNDTNSRGSLAFSFANKEDEERVEERFASLQVTQTAILNSCYMPSAALAVQVIYAFPP